MRLTVVLVRLLTVSTCLLRLSVAFAPCSRFGVPKSTSSSLVVLKARQKKKKRHRSAPKPQPPPPPPDDSLKSKTPPLGRATNLPTADLAGVSEDHRFEQFFYDESSTRRLFKIVSSFSKPLLVCNPSLAVESERHQRNYLLLDRDDRFDFLSGFRRFDLARPHLVPRSYEYDAVFLDPPFANVTPAGLADCLAVMAPDGERASVPAYVAYNSEREDELLAAFSERYAGPPLERKFRLWYRTVPAETEEKIWLYGPAGGNWPC